jgi:type III secretory pathway component EscS
MPIEDARMLTAAFKVVALASMPFLLVAVVVGVLVGLLQAVLQLQDQAIGYVLKVFAVSATLLLAATWIMGQVVHLFDLILDAIHLTDLAAWTASNPLC